MKLLAGFLAIVVSSVGFANTQHELRKNTTLASPGDFVILSDVEQSEINVFLSYAGRQMDRCGVALRASSTTTTGHALSEIITIKVDLRSPKEAAELLDGQLVAVVPNPDTTIFGEYFTIQTKTGLSLKSALQSLNDREKIEVIVDVLSCAALAE